MFRGLGLMGSGRELRLVYAWASRLGLRRLNVKV